jgi:hypothetical protein
MLCFISGPGVKGVITTFCSSDPTTILNYRMSSTWINGILHQGDYNIVTQIITHWFFFIRIFKFNNFVNFEFFIFDLFLNLNVSFICQFKNEIAYNKFKIVYIKRSISLNIFWILSNLCTNA